MTSHSGQDTITEKQFLQNYDADRYERPSVSVDLLLFSVSYQERDNYRKLSNKVMQVLLVQRGQHPYLHQWALPGGFAGIEESLDEAARRELASETEVSDVYLEQLYTWGEPKRDPRTRVISCSYMALVDSAALKLRAGDDAEDVKWFTVRRKVIERQDNHEENERITSKTVKLEFDADGIHLEAIVKTTVDTEGKDTRIRREVLQSEGLAFDHATIINYGIERLRNKLIYTGIVFNLMPKQFTLTDLQQVYEVILDKDLLKANFRRKIAMMVLPTEYMTKDDGHRPARLYRFNPQWKREQNF